MDELLPLFPLDLVLLPGAYLPLHVFEDRYKELIGECLEAQSRGFGQEEFGVVLAKDGKVRSVGCTAHIEEVTRRYDDGRLDIFTIGRRRFEVRSTDSTRAFLQADVEFFEDDPLETPSEIAVAQALELFAKLVKRYNKAEEFVERFPRPEEYISFQIASALPIDVEIKQRLLAQRNELERLKEVSKAMEVLLKQLDLRDRVRAKAGGNGHVQVN